LPIFTYSIGYWEVYRRFRRDFFLVRGLGGGGYGGGSFHGGCFLGGRETSVYFPITNTSQWGGVLVYTSIGIYFPMGEVAWRRELRGRIFPRRMFPWGKGYFYKGVPDFPALFKKRSEFK
jgi:hypothetical protein